jgi:molybdopterin molybdotransferase
MSDTQWSSVLGICLSLLAPAEEESVPRRQALGRLLLETVVADRDYPSGDLSTMDGYAVSAERHETYQVSGENRPGNGPGEPLAPGTARRIFTGAELPLHAVRVIPQEMTNRDDVVLAVHSHPTATYTRSAGCEAMAGNAILGPGVRITPVSLSILATVGATSIRVARQPTVAHIVTGDELVDPDSASSIGSRIRDSNSELVASTLHLAGYAVTHHRRISDDKDILIAAIEEAARSCGVLLISGGASVGDHDYARAALESAGFHFEIESVHLRPGKPLGIARRQHQWAFALPGNPVSHLVALHLFVIPLLRGIEGEKRVEPKLLGGILREAPSAGTPRRPTFWPATAVVAGSTFHLHACRFLSSGDLIGIAEANALLFLEVDVAIPAAGTPVRFIPLNFYGATQH